MFSLTRAFPPEHLDSAVTLGVVQPQLGQGEGHGEGSAWCEDTYYVECRVWLVPAVHLLRKATATEVLSPSL